MHADLLYIGLTSATAPLAIRERVRPTPDQQREMLSHLGGIAHGRMILATCERCEIYAVTDVTDLSRWKSCLAESLRLPLDVLEEYTVVRRGASAAEHLLRVAAGLESRVLGEPQILGQVRTGYAAAGEIRALDPVLAALGRHAIRVGRRVRAETQLNRSGQSIGTVAVDHVLGLYRRNGPTVTGGLAQDSTASIVIVGSGHMAADVAAHAARRGTKRVIVGRNRHRGDALAYRFGAIHVPFEGLAAAIVDADGVIVCTSAPSYVIDQTSVSSERHRPLHLVDLCVPRNVDPAIARMEGVNLWHLDELLAGRATITSGVTLAEAIVREEHERFNRWRQERLVAGRISALIHRANQRVVPLTLEDKRRIHRQIVRLKAGTLLSAVAAA